MKNTSSFNWDQKRMTSDQVILHLKEGHKRYLQGVQLGPISSKERNKWHNSQDPLATIISCSDSRVLPAKIFDVGISDIFSVEVAGNLVDGNGLGSIEYAVLHAHTAVIIMLGHQHCGAVGAALDGNEAYQNEPYNIRCLLDKLENVINDTRRKQQISKIPSTGSSTHHEYWMKATEANVYYQIGQILDNSLEIKKLYGDGLVRIIPAIYMLDGSIKWLDD